MNQQEVLKYIADQQSTTSWLTWQVIFPTSLLLLIGIYSSGMDLSSFFWRGSLLVYAAMLLLAAFEEITRV